nr:unnamed protein product [Digitaria exilis]
MDSARQNPKKQDVHATSVTMRSTPARGPTVTASSAARKPAPKTSGNEKTSASTGTTTAGGEVLRDVVGPEVEQEAEHGAQLRHEPQWRLAVAVSHECHHANQEQRQRAHGGMGVGPLPFLFLLAVGGDVFFDG